MSRPEDDAEASTMAVGRDTLPDRSSRPAIGREQLGAGTRVGRYELRARLGAGAMGVVWSARDPELDRDVAIKLVHPALYSDEAASRFRREARAMAKLSHRSVITVHDTGVVDGQLFLVMELVRGTTLGQLLRERDAAQIADWPRWLAMLIDAGRGLAEAHRNGVLHRDFKPDNVLVDGAGRVCVGDFGLASLGDRPAVRPSSPVGPITLGETSPGVLGAFDLTTTGAVLGTPLYMSPQQLNGEPIDERADQFAFCVALHEAVYGHRPFATDSQGLAAIPELIEQIAAGLPTPASAAVPRELHDCIARGLAFEPADRWPDLATLLAALERVARPRRATVIEARTPPRWVWPALAAVLVAATATIVVVVAVTSSTSPAEPAAPAVAPRARRSELAKLFEATLNTKTAISADGRILAVASERLELRTLEADGTASKPFASLRLAFPVLYLEVDDREVRFGAESNSGLWRWRYREASEAVEVARLPGQWRGTTVAGELVRIADRGLAIARPDGTLDTWPGRALDVAAISPDRRRVAFIEGGRFTGTISVRDVATGAVVTSPAIAEPMALAWSGPTTLLYSTSTMIAPELLRTEVGTAFGESTTIYEQPTGWFSDIHTGGSEVLVMSMAPSPRGKVVRPGQRNSELDSVSLAIGWDAAGKMVTWNRATLQVSSHAGRLDSEPANATRAGDTLIAAVRALGGRRAVAISLSTGAERWRHPDARTIAVRCAGDAAPPCFAIRYVDEHHDQLVTLDPETGALGRDVIYADRRIEDVAVREDGRALLVTQGSRLVEIAPDGTRIGEHPLTMPDGKPRMRVVRSVAYAKGGFVLAGTVGRNAYQVGWVRDGSYESLDDAYDKIQLLARPSADGSTVVFVARSYEPVLMRLRQR